MAATQQEDFSFPTTTDTPPRFIESPRLWRETSLVSSSSSSSTHERRRSTPERERENDDEDDDFDFLWKKKANATHQRKSFSLIECGTKRRTAGGDDDEDCVQEKMDMLWEDFNYEDFSSRNSRINDDSGNFHGDHDDGRMVNFGCVRSLKLSKPINKRPSIVVFIKVLKKMLLLQNSHRTTKKSQ